MQKKKRRETADRWPLAWTKKPRAHVMNAEKRQKYTSAVVSIMDLPDNPPGPGPAGSVPAFMPGNTAGPVRVTQDQDVIIVQQPERKQFLLGVII